MTTGVYKIYCTETDSFYIGSSSKCIYKRFKTHLSNLKGSRHANIHLQNIYNKYGKISIELEIIEIIEDVTTILDRETFYIKTLKPSINQTFDAKAPMKGKKHSKEAKLKMSKNSTRHNKGVSPNDNVRLKNVISNGGSMIICIDTGEIFISIAEAARKLKLSRQNISSVIHGRLKTTGKLKFKRYKLGE